MILATLLTMLIHVSERKQKPLLGGLVRSRNWNGNGFPVPLPTPPKLFLSDQKRRRLRQIVAGKRSGRDAGVKEHLVSDTEPHCRVHYEPKMVARPTICILRQGGSLSRIEDGETRQFSVNS